MPAEAVGVDRSLPSRHVLRAAFQVSRLVRKPEESIAGLREAYGRIPTDGLYDPHSFQRGEHLLSEAGLIEFDDGVVKRSPRLRTLQGLEQDEACRIILAVLLETRRPLWLSVAVGDAGVQPAYIPDRIEAELEELFPDRDARIAFLLSLGKVDADARNELGLQGEEFVVDACRDQRERAGYSRLAQQVQQVSVISDGFGYDISAPCPGSSAHHLEVKTVGSSRSRLTVHLSRHQMRVAQRDAAWRLVVCRRTEDSFKITGWCDVSALEGHWPRDPSPADGIDARWETVRVVLEEDVLSPGLPPLRPESGR